ncbi:hypothetical protein J31TS4_03690 [Paenibacillus sp. J31TS4]|nr:hypothetical protein J31TS4_03690 [Paenibacillus sp. J31TS4]
MSVSASALGFAAVFALGSVAVFALEFAAVFALEFAAVFVPGDAVAFVPGDAVASVPADADSALAVGNPDQSIEKPLRFAVNGSPLYSLRLSGVFLYACRRGMRTKREYIG